MSLALPLPAQTFWQPPDGADLATWIAQASPGDVLELASTHPPFQLTKGLTLLGHAAGTRIVNTSPSPLLVGSTATVPAGQTSHLIGLQFEEAFGAGGWLAISGDVTIDNCSFLAHWEPAVLVLSGRVLLQDCSLRCLSRWSGLHVYPGGIVSAIGCQFAGAPGWFDPNNVFFNPNPGLTTYGAVFLSNCTVTGGSSSHFVPYQPGQPEQGRPAPGLWGIWSDAYVTDCTLIGGSSTGPVQTQGAPAANTGGNVTHARTQFIAGTGSIGGPGFVGIGDPWQVGMRRNGGLRRGHTFSATARAGTSLGALAFFASFQLSPSTLPITTAPLFLDTTQLIGLSLFLPVAGGYVTQSIQVPNSAPLVGATVWLQAAQLAGSAIYASAPVGGVVR